MVIYGDHLEVHKGKMEHIHRVMNIEVEVGAFGFTTIERDDQVHEKI